VRRREEGPYTGSSGCCSKLRIDDKMKSQVREWQYRLKSSSLRHEAETVANLYLFMTGIIKMQTIPARVLEKIEFIFLSSTIARAWHLLASVLLLEPHTPNPFICI
jgi:hypothetical protein